MAIQQFFATCPRGLEPLLQQELQALGAKQLDPCFGNDFYLQKSLKINLFGSRLGSRSC